MTVLGAVLLFRQYPTNAELGAILLSFFGVSLIVSRGNLSLDCFQGSRGELLMLFAVLSEALYILTVKKVSSSYSPLFLSFITGLTGVLFVIPLILNYCFIDAIAKLSFFQWALLAYISCFGSALAIICYSAAISRAGPSRTSLIVFGSMPLFTAVIAFIFLGECLSIWDCAGAFFVMLGLLLAEGR